MTTPITNWVGKKVWIIGASFGIGKSLAELLAHKGAILSLSGRSESALDDVKSSLTSKEHMVKVVDVGSEESLRRAFESILERFKKIDVIIYCAGTYHPGPFLQGSSIDFVQTLDTNFMGAVRLLQVAGPHFSQDKKCQMVFISSVAAYNGLPNSNVYGPSKAALLNFCEGMRVELEDKGMDIRVVNPGFVATRLTDKNQFPMPMKITPEKSATLIVKGLGTHSFQIDFPKPISLFLRFLRLLPYRMYFWFAQRLK